MQDLRLAGKVWFSGKINLKITRSVKKPFHKYDRLARDPARQPARRTNQLVGRPVTQSVSNSLTQSERQAYILLTPHVFAKSLLTKPFHLTLTFCFIAGLKSWIFCFTAGLEFNTQVPAVRSYSLRFVRTTKFANNIARRIKAIAYYDVVLGAISGAGKIKELK